MTDETIEQRVGVEPLSGEWRTAKKKPDDDSHDVQQSLEHVNTPGNKAYSPCWNRTPSVR